MSMVFLGFVAFFPRLTLLTCWLFNMLPENGTPAVLDAVCLLIAPRLLVAYWAYEAGAHPLWVILLVGLQLIEWMKTSRSAQINNKQRKVIA